MTRHVLFRHKLRWNTLIQRSNLSDAHANLIEKDSSRRLPPSSSVRLFTKRRVSKNCQLKNALEYEYSLGKISCSEEQYACQVGENVNLADFSWRSFCEV